MCAQAVFSEQRIEVQWEKIVSQAQLMVEEIRFDQNPLFIYSYVFRNDHSLGVVVTTTRFHRLCLPLSGFQPSEFLLSRDFPRVLLWVPFLVASIPLPPQLFCFFPFPSCTLSGWSYPLTSLASYRLRRFCFVRILFSSVVE